MAAAKPEPRCPPPATRSSRFFRKQRHNPGPRPGRLVPKLKWILLELYARRRNHCPDRCCRQREAPPRLCAAGAAAAKESGEHSDPCAEGVAGGLEYSAGALPRPQAGEGRQREGYLHRLGISRDGRTALVRRPLAIEADLEEDRLDVRRQEDFRSSFLQKLSYQGVWVPQVQRPPTHQTVVIFDWDDTLLCTSFLMMQQDRPLPPHEEDHLLGVARTARHLLERAARVGHTFIVTNAEEGWVEHSAARYAPDVLSVLPQVRVISARGMYEAQFPNEVIEWKTQAFLEVQRQLDAQIITNLISIGDSAFELHAAHVMHQGFAQSLIKTIKFRANPAPDELLKELELVSTKFERIVAKGSNLSIGFGRKDAGRARP